MNDRESPDPDREPSVVRREDIDAGPDGEAEGPARRARRLAASREALADDVESGGP